MVLFDVKNLLGKSLFEDINISEILERGWIAMVDKKITLYVEVREDYVEITASDKTYPYKEVFKKKGFKWTGAVWQLVENKEFIKKWKEFVKEIVEEIGSKEIKVFFEKEETKEFFIKTLNAKELKIGEKKCIE